MEYGDMSLNGKNPNETVEGMHSIIFNIIKEITKLEDENMIITECNVQLKFIEGPGIQEYQQYQDGKFNIMVDKTSLEEAMESIRKQKEYRPLVLLLEKFGQAEFSRWINEDEFKEFAIEFTKIYDSIYGKLESFDPEDSEEDYYDYFDINEILKEHNIPWKIRHTCGGYRQYAITKSR